MRKSCGAIPRPALAGLLLLILGARGFAQKHYDPGASDTEITIGNIVPYTGAFSEYGATGRAEAAYFRMINEMGGINGRKIRFLSLDSASSVSKVVELARQLVEQDQVLLTFSNWGTAPNLAIRAYLNDRKVPQLFVDATDSAFDDPAHFPWTMGFQPSRSTEGMAYAKYILRSKPAAKIGILYSRDASGQEWLSGVRDGLGEKASAMIVKELAFDYADPAALGARVAELKTSGADVFLNLTVGRYTTRVLREAYDMDWHPLQFIPNASLSVAAFLDPAGRKKAVGIISNARSKGWLKPQAQQDPAVRAFLDWMKTYNPDASLRDAGNVYGYEAAQTLVEVLKRCGDDLTRANVMKHAASLNLELGMLRPGIKVTTSATDYQPIKQLFLVRFDGEDWVSAGDLNPVLP